MLGPPPAVNDGPDERTSRRRSSAMTIDQTAPRANDEDARAAEPFLLVRAEDGTVFTIPKSIVEAHRLSDEQRAALEAQFAADATDTDGFDLSSGGFVGPDYKRPPSLPFYDS